MDSKEKKRWLCRYRLINAEIASLVCERDALREMSVKITPNYSDMPKGCGGGSKVENAVLALVSVENRIDAAVGSLVKIRDEIMAAIDGVDDPVYRQLLRLRYINCQKWEEIAVSMNYYGRHLFKLHGRALQAINIPDCKRGH